MVDGGRYCAPDGPWAGHRDYLSKISPRITTPGVTKNRPETAWECPDFGPRNTTSTNRHQIHPKIGHFTWLMGVEIAGLRNPGQVIGGVAFIAEVHAIHIHKCMQNI